MVSLQQRDCSGKNADLIDGPAGGRGQGGDFGAQRDTTLMGGVHGQQNRNARVEQNFLLQARQAKLPIVGEHGVPAIAENTLKKLCRVGKAAGAENHERTRQNAECARHAQRMAELNHQKDNGKNQVEDTLAQLLLKCQPVVPAEQQRRVEQPDLLCAS